jgi:transcription-repair coupling factor (superfamily II helicase)
MTEAAHDRLATIAQHTDLGSGMAVAMKDLEIRGAGNVLGGEQSGHIEGVGFDLYLRLVGEAVTALKGGVDGDEPTEPAEIRVDLPVDAHLPHSWVPSERVRLQAYQRIADSRDASSLADVHEEMIDRFGALPDPVERLFDVAKLRALLRTVQVTELVAQGAKIRLFPVQLPESATLRLTRLYPGTIVKPAVRTILVPRPTAAGTGGEPLRDRELLEWATQLVQAVLAPVPVS